MSQLTKLAIECVWMADAQLGEGPLWVEREQALYFVDLLAGLVHRFRPADGACATFPQREAVGFVVPRIGGGFVAGAKSGFQFVDLESETTVPIAAPEAHLPNNRMNDGKVDSAERLWAGTMDLDCAAPSGSLYRLATDLSCVSVDSGYLCTNGPAFSRDGGILYHTDSMRRTIYAFDLDAETGEIANKRVFVQLGDGDGYPDGMTVDSEDRLWVAHFGGGRVTAFRTDGRIDRTIELPVPLATSCAFGGTGLRTLYITTAHLGLTPEQRATAPLSGALLAVEDVAEGLPSPAFGG